MGALYSDTAAPAPAPAPPRPNPVAAGAAVYAAAALLLGVAITYLALRTRAGQRLDEEAQRAVSGPQATVRLVLEALSWVSMGSVLLAVLAAMAWALLRGRYAHAMGALLMVGGAIATTELLKFRILSKPDFGLGHNNSLPSGHTTVVTSVALAGILVAPALTRTFLTVLGGVAATMVGTGTLIARWHRPADVVVALAVCAIWAAPALMLAGRFEPPTAGGARVQRPSHLLALLGAGTVGAIVVMLGVRPTQGRYGLVPAIVCLGTVGLASALCVGGFSRLVDRLSS